MEHMGLAHLSGIYITAFLSVFSTLAHLNNLFNVNGKYIRNGGITPSDSRFIRIGRYIAAFCWSVFVMLVVV